MTVYLDHHATTPCDPSVVAAMLPFFGEHFGNAGSRHTFGAMAAAAVDLGRQRVADVIGAEPEEIVFTSGATESNHLAILGAAAASSTRRHLITTTIEHKAVLEPMYHLQTQGFELSTVPVSADGRVDPDQLAGLLRDDTLLVSVMLANNEIGAVQPVREIAHLTHQRGALLHVDAAQGVGRLPVDVRDLGVDLLSITAHKLYGPKGIGALYVRSGRPLVRLEPLQRGGGQERGLRAGTLPVPLIVAFGVACQLAAADLASGEPARLGALRDRLWSALQQLGGVSLNGSADHRLPGNLNCAFDGCRATDLMTRMPEIACSSGSACSQANPRPSHVLLALGGNAVRATSSLRFGLGRTTTDADIDVAIRAVTRAVSEVRR